MWATMKYVSLTWMSNGIMASITPEIPPSVNMVRKPSANSIGVSRCSTPRHRVASQEKILMPVGTAITAVVTIIGIRIQDDDRHQGEGHHPVAEDRFSRLHRDDLRDDPEPRQHHDVHGGVRVEPEDVLVHEHVAVGA